MESNRVYKLVDTCSAEFESKTPYLYSTNGVSNDDTTTDKKKVVVIGSGPNRIGRGNSIKANVVEKYCKENNISIDYFKGDSVYLDMEYGLCVSFKEIFTNKFVDSNNPIYNIHLSLLPMYRGPSPVENPSSFLRKPLDSFRPPR